MNALPAHSEAPPASPRTRHYCERMDKYLDGMEPAAQWTWLSKELVNWIALRERFIAAVESEDYVDQGEDGPDIYDYTLTICEISVRRERLAGGRPLHG